MMHHSQLRLPRRAPRINLRGSVSAIIQLENGRRRPAYLHQLSIRGGLLELADYVEERARVSLTFQIGSALVYPKAEMLFPICGGLAYLQPFRFTCFRDQERETLDREIIELRKQTLLPASQGQGLAYRRPRFMLESL
jgi:hypothetical protein